MKALSDKQQAAAQEQLLKLLCFNCLPMLLALILLGWLSFGLPHPTWLLLLKTIVQADTLIAQQGMSFLLPLFILAIQSIFLICAWGLLIWGITREVRTLIAFYSDIATLQTARPSVAAAAATATPVAPQPAVPPVVPNPYPSSYAPPQSYTPPPPPSSSIPPNPFATDDEEDFPTELIDLPTQLTTPPDYDIPAVSQSASTKRYASYDLLVGAAQHKDESDYLQIEEPVHDERDEEPPRKRSTSIQRRAPISSYESDQDDDISWKRPADQEVPVYTPPPAPAEDPLEATVIANRSKMNKERQEQESKQARQVQESKQALPAASPKRQPTQPAQQPSDPFSVVEDDPFAVKEDVLHVFEQEDPEEQMQEEEEQASEDDSIFVYGNPFEGPLPDVFMHDEDLKRSIEEQNITISEDGTSQAAPKKTNQKPTGIRKRS
ncbi:hypothetical protein KSF_036990 [Reticulibacter mediterranei]|uniref:Uncharacterized protein n=1 Tax=Reticulibacter mediterranei TaxID=2778369 RepID=A0A8J3IQP7_9CHLR|nr:hypothetical protein [Reticulibacter mediterranei]GHO93651.1 hypothetical protein KSF_036990 [Reticulibacter mediterranei]